MKLLFTLPNQDAQIPFARTAGRNHTASVLTCCHVEAIVLGRCSMCHAREPAWEGLRHAPKAVLLENAADITAAARQIYLQSGVTRAMPPGNITYMEPEERRKIIRWFRTAGNGAQKSAALDPSALRAELR